MKILLCFGTRPEAIKMAPIYHQFCQSELVEDKKSNFDVKICVTAQHREMLDQVLDFFEMKPDYDLDLMQPNQNLNQLGAAILEKLNQVLIKEKPDWVLVQGDTTTALFATLAAFHLGIKVGHIEAGLRTYNKTAPYPEEINRQLITKMADLHAAPTIKAQQNLISEGIDAEVCPITGNTVVDALLMANEKLDRGYKNQEMMELENLLNFNKKWIVVTGHRRENHGKGIQELVEALLMLAKREDVEIIFPVHLNPNVSAPVYELLKDKKSIHLIPPLSYPSMVWLLSKSSLIITDSGGIQEEAPTFGVPVIVTRETTERMESINLGLATLTGMVCEEIINKAHLILDDKTKSKKIKNPYGDGGATERIISYLKKCT